MSIKILLAILLALYSINIWAVPCSGIWANGFPDERFKKQECKDISHPNFPREIKLYHMPNLGDEESQYRAKVFVQQALMEVYAKLEGLGGRVGKIWATYVHDYSPRDAESRLSWAQAMVYSSHAQGQEGCALILYKNIHSQSDQQIKQIVAHEIFHCYQEWNYPESFKVDGKISGWWVEGTADAIAEYFYPNADYESSRDPLFDPAKSIFEQTFPYVNYMYFSSILQDESVKQLLFSIKHHTTPNATLAEQVKAWGGNYNTGFQFHDFAKKYTSGELSDSGGRKIVALKAPHFQSMGAPPANFRGEGYPVMPYSFYMQGIHFQKDGFYKLEFIPQGDASLAISYRKKGDKEWTDHFMVPGVKFTVDTSCQQDTIYEFLITTAGENLEEKKYDINYEYEKSPCDCEDKLGVDSCLTGRWRLDPETFNSYYRRQVVDRMNGMNPRYHGTDGNIFMDFLDNKDVKSVLNNFGVALEFSVGGMERPIDVFTTVSMEGLIESRYGRPSVGKLCLQKPTSTAKAHTTVVMGSMQNESTIDLEPTEGQELEYSCDSKYLLLKFRPKGTDLVIDLGFFKE